MYEIKLEGKQKSITDATEFVSRYLTKYHVKSREIKKAMLLTEETIASMCSNETPPETINVRVYRKCFLPMVRIEANGDCISGDFAMPREMEFSLDDIDSPDGIETIRNLVLKAGKERLEVRQKKNRSHVSITVGEPSKKRVIVTIMALVLGLLTGFIMRLLFPENVISTINGYVLEPIKTVFLNMLSMLMGPLIFFSIASCVGTFSDIREIGKIGAKVILFYAFTSLVAIGVSFLFFFTLCHAEFNGFSDMVTGTAVTETMEGVNLLETLLDIFPSNFFGAFVNSKTLQIMVIALLMGIATTMLGAKSRKVSDFLNTANDLFCTMTTIITNLISVMVFASMCSMAATMNLSTLKGAASIVLIIILACVAMSFLYTFFVFIFTGERPGRFIKNAFPAWLTAFSLSSSGAAMPNTMSVCEKRLKISPRVFSFSIPIGASINMDGATILLTVSALFFARVFGVTLTANDYVMLIFMVILLSMGAPGIPGACIVCESVLLSQLNVPSEALAIFVAISSITDPLATANNVLGDVTGSFIVAKKTGNMTDSK